MNPDYCELGEQAYKEREEYYREVHSKETAEDSGTNHGSL